MGSGNVTKLAGKGPKVAAGNRTQQAKINKDLAAAARTQITMPNARRAKKGGY